MYKSIIMMDIDPEITIIFFIIGLFTCTILLCITTIEAAAAALPSITICGPADKLMTFTDPNRVIKEYFCHDI